MCLGRIVHNPRACGWVVLQSVEGVLKTFPLRLRLTVKRQTLAQRKNRTGRIRTCNQGIMRTNYGFRRLFRVWGLDHTFTLRVCRLVSTPSAIENRFGLLDIGLARD